jgi:hypothetical protein
MLLLLYPDALLLLLGQARGLHAGQASSLRWGTC